MRDAGRVFTVAERSAQTVPGGSATLHYTGAPDTGAANSKEYISAMITETDTGRVLYYGRIKHLQSAADANGTVKVTVPAGLAEGVVESVKNAPAAAG